MRRAALPCLLLVTYFLSAAWSLSTPVANDSNSVEWGNFHPDEGDHTNVILYMADKKALPPYEKAYYISVHPPLYHALAAVWYSLASPRVGREQALLQIRLLTALCGVGVVCLTYQATRRLASRSTALVAASLVAFLPMRVSLGGGIANDDLAALGAAGALAVMVGGICDGDGFKPRQIALLALYLCIGIGSKITCVGLLPVIGIAIFWKARNQRTPVARATGQFLVICAIVAAVWGWWFVRNQMLYGDPVRNAVADRVWNIPDAPAYVAMHQSAIRYALGIAWTGWRSFWGMFDGMQRPMPLIVYIILAPVPVLALKGLSKRWQERPVVWRNAAAFWLMMFYAAFVLSFFCLYNVRHYAGQGRYLFVLLLPFGLLMAIGWRAALPARTRRWATPALVTFMAVLNLYLLYVIPRRLTYFFFRAPTHWVPPPPVQTTS